MEYGTQWVYTVTSMQPHSTHTQRFAPKAYETNNNSNYSVVKAIITACMLPSSSSLLLHLHYGILFVYLLHMQNMQLILCIECSHIWQSYAHRRGIGWSVCMFREKTINNKYGDCFCINNVHICYFLGGRILGKWFVSVWCCYISFGFVFLVVFFFNLQLDF